MKRYHVHVYQVSAEVELDVEAGSIQEAQTKAKELAAKKGGGVHFGPPSLKHLAFVTERGEAAGTERRRRKT